jgi:hypothetical protein
MKERKLTRRRLGRWAAAAFGFSIGKELVAAPPASALSWDQPGADRTVERRYRADAQILLMGLPLFHRAGVGGGSVVWSDSKDQDGNVLRHLEFMGYSSPERAAGLNRLGFIRELTRTGAAGEESIYFGLMTASNEATAEEAKAALASKSTEAPYSAIEGRVGSAGVSTISAHFMGPAKVTADRRAELVAMAQQALATGERKDAEFRGAPPFLNALADALNGPEQTQSRFVYSGRAYQLSIKQAPDAKAADFFQKRRIIAAGTQVIRAAGKLRRESGGNETEFHLWVAKGEARKLPLRIEYQPKSFLRLTFEAEA